MTIQNIAFNKNTIIKIGMLILLISSASTIKSYASSINTQVYQKAKQDTIYLFHGKSLNNFKIVWRNKKDYRKKLYSLSKGSVIFKSNQVGYIRTKRVYHNFILHAEWAWLSPNENGNSGILIYIQKPDVVWPTCIQVNYKNQHAGAFISMNGTFFKQARNKPQGVVPIINKPSEKPIGEWNTCKVICKDNSILVYVNGVLQNKATHVTLKSGYIGFQMEGKPVKFKNIYLIKK